MYFSSNDFAYEFFLNCFCEVDARNDVFRDFMFIDVQVSNIQESNHSTNNVMRLVRFDEFSIDQRDTAVDVEIDLRFLVLDR